MVLSVEIEEHVLLRRFFLAIRAVILKSLNEHAVPINTDSTNGIIWWCVMF